MPLSRDQAKYLFTVMRQGTGDVVTVFNGVDGQWQAEISKTAKSHGTLICRIYTAPLRMPPDLWLLFAPIKKNRTDFIVEKAVELGAARICPVRTAFTNAERIRQDRLQAHAIEAAEQCGGTFVPPVMDLKRLQDVLETWPHDRRLILADETLIGTHTPPLSAIPPADKWAILIGPEGGFSDAERARMAALPYVTPIGLGPRILRADTATIAALTLWQSIWGDWR